MTYDSKYDEFLRSLSPQQRDEFLRESVEIAAARARAEQIAARQLTMDFETFKTRFWKRYQRAIFDTLLDEKLSQLAEYLLTDGRSGIGRLAVFAPPRHGKTTRISQMFPAWLFSQKPDLRMITASYGTDLSTRNSRAVRNLMLSNEYTEAFPLTRLASERIDMWDTTAGGLLLAGSVGSAIVGHGGQLLIIDDPVKNRAEAESDVLRQRAKDWYNNDLLSRLEEPGGAILLIATRYHQDDLSGYLLNDEDADEWTVLSFPAIAEENDLLGRAEGEALWPERYPADKLAKRRKKMGEYAWNSLYQQRPIPAEGGLFKREYFNLTNGLPEMVNMVRYWDLAMSSKTTADYTVGVKMGAGSDGRIYILDVVRFQKEWGDVVPEIASVAITDGPRVAIGIEQAGYMSRAIQELNQDGRLHNYTVMGYEVDKDKVTRALPIVSHMAAGEVSLLHRHWTEAYIEELCSFPSGRNDDQVDATSGAWAMLGNSFGVFEGALIHDDDRTAYITSWGY